MKQAVRRGLDYTPLFRFLLSNVGEAWEKVHSEAVARLDREEPIFWMVAKKKEEAEPYVLLRENAYFSGLYIDDDGFLQITAPEIGPGSLLPTCSCCTHTFNGIPFTKKFAWPQSD